MKLNTAFKAIPQRKTKLGNAGYDNIRDNIDPHIKTKVVSTKEGSIQHIPTNDDHIVNVKYVATNFMPLYDYFVWDETNKRLGIKNNSPSHTMDIGGNLNFTLIDEPTDAEEGAINLTENLSGGTLSAGKYYYGFQWIDDEGNTCGSDYSNLPDITISANSSVTLSNIPLTNGDHRISGRRIFRTLAGGGQHTGQKLFDINDITTTSWTDTGTTGQIAWDTNYIYVCTATNTWKRTALSSW